MEVAKCRNKEASIQQQGMMACNNNNMLPLSILWGVVPARGEPPEGGRGDAPDHFLRSGLLRLLSSQSPRLARGSLRQRLGR